MLGNAGKPGDDPIPGASARSRYAALMHANILEVITVSGHLVVDKRQSEWEPDVSLRERFHFPNLFARLECEPKEEDHG